MKIKRIILSLLVVTAVSASAIFSTTAFFSDTETSEGNVLAAGAIDLKIDNTSYVVDYLVPDHPDPDGSLVLNDGTTWTLADLNDGEGPGPNNSYLFFNFEDLKPGDWGEDTISLHVNNNPAWACMDLNLTSNSDNGYTEPELEVDDTTDPEDPFGGELAQELNFVFWADDGDNVYEEGEYIIKQGTGLDVLNSSWALADSTINVWNDQLNSEPLEGSSDESENVYYVGKAWCLGTLGLDPQDPQGDNHPTTNPGVTCNGQSVTNASQTDMLTADVSFTAIQHRNNPNFECVGCEDTGEGWASNVDSFNQGLTKGGDPVDASRSNPSEALNSPDGDFVSLGEDGSIVLTFANPIVNDQAQTVEISGNRTAAHEEKALVHVSSNGTDWELIGEAKSTDNGNGTTFFDLSGVSTENIQYIRLTDNTDFSIHPDHHDGYDVDAVGVTVCLDETPNLEVNDNDQD